MPSTWISNENFQESVLYFQWDGTKVFGILWQSACILSHDTGPSFVLTTWTLRSQDRLSPLDKVERTNSQSI